MATPAMPPAPTIESPHAPERINPDLYLNRELSWIAFNGRVLEEAADPRNPLLERVKFLAIFSTNLDEFFMVRVSGVKGQIEAGVDQRSLSGQTPLEQYQAIRAALRPQIDACQRLLRDELLPALRAAGVSILSFGELSDHQRTALQQYYEREIFPILTPLAVDPSHPFPFISNLNLNLAVELADPAAGQRFARIKIPELLPRLVRLPPEPAEADGARQPACFVWAEELIAANLASLFPGMQVREACAFRITRNTDLEIQEDEASDLLETMREHVRQRRFGPVVRLSLDARASAEVRAVLMKNLRIHDEDVYDVGGPLRLSALMDLYALNRPDLKDPPFVPALPDDLAGGADIFAAIRRQPLLLQHPFDSFTPIVDLLYTAVRDPHVLAIKQTLYRVGRNSPIVAALMAAREEGKQVTVLVELKARFDEENNIEWARALEAAGVHVVYGVAGLKTHAKLLLIVRKEPDGLRRYVHLGTGNYNAATARVYTDLGMLTSDEAIGADVSELFNVLTGYGDQTHYRKLLVAPGGLRAALQAQIEREIDRHQQAGDGHLIFKCNALTDERLIMALYRAARAGVRVDLLVRGICCLRPGIPGLSETVRVRSVVGRFLEHSRIYYFHNGGAEQLYLGSADLMSRNLDRRVETLFPIDDPRLRRYLRDTVLDLYLRDNALSRELLPDGSYARVSPGDQPEVSAQRTLLEREPRADRAAKPRGARHRGW